MASSPSTPTTTPRPSHKRQPSAATTTYRSTTSDPQRYSETMASSPPFPSRSPPKATASKIITTVRRSLSVAHSASSFKRRQLDVSTSGMYSTPEERHPLPSAWRQQAASPPTIEQIAMGLHLSRTPHLRPAQASSTSRNTVVPLPPSPSPPPPRSSLKAPSNPGLSTASSTTITSTTPSTPHSNRSLASLKTKVMSRFLPGPRSSSASPGIVSPPSEELRPAKKAVRFTTPEA